VKGLHVEMKIRKHTKRIFEIVNVFSRDLNLINALFNDTYVVSDIDLYYKPDADPAKPDVKISLTRLISSFSTILKTNLSIRTSPPLFETGADAFATDAFDADKEFWDDSNAADKKNFIRLVWEALTTNNGGYYLVTDTDVQLPTDDADKGLTDA